MPVQQQDIEFSSTSKQCLPVLLEMENSVTASSSPNDSLGGFKCKGISPIIPVDLEFKDAPSLVAQLDGIYNGLQRFEPRVFARPKPMELPLDEDGADSLEQELYWLQEDVSSHLNVIWDVTMEDDQDEQNLINAATPQAEKPHQEEVEEEEEVADESKQFDELFLRACQKQLLPTQQKFVNSVLKQKQHVLVNNQNLITSARFTGLVNYNPEIAAQALSALINTPKITEYVFFFNI